MLRSLILAVDVLPGCYFLGIVSLLLTRRFQRLGDLAAGTLVVHEQAPQASTVAETPAEPPPVKLRPEEAFALVEYLERVEQLSAERSSELAAIIAEPLGAPPAGARSSILRIASGLRGQQ